MYVQVPQESDPRLKEKKESLSEAELREARCCHTCLTFSWIVPVAYLVACFCPRSAGNMLFPHLKASWKVLANHLISFGNRLTRTCYKK